MMSVMLLAGALAGGTPLATLVRVPCARFMPAAARVAIDVPRAMRAPPPRRDVRRAPCLRLAGA